MNNTKHSAHLPTTRSLFFFHTSPTKHTHKDDRFRRNPARSEGVALFGSTEQRVPLASRGPAINITLYASYSTVITAQATGMVTYQLTPLGIPTSSEYLEYVSNVTTSTSESS